MAASTMALNCATGQERSGPELHVGITAGAQSGGLLELRTWAVRICDIDWVWKCTFTYHAPSTSPSLVSPWRRWKPIMPPGGAMFGLYERVFWRAVSERGEGEERGGQHRKIYENRST
jgi:hypothetical protein